LASDFAAGRDQRAQLGIIAGVAAHLRRALGCLADEPGPQVRACHADHRALELFAVGDHQIAQRSPARLVADRPPQRGREPLLSIEVESRRAA
jgi:pyruvate kinase